jgi:hypothetical protein
MHVGQVAGDLHDFGALHPFLADTREGVEVDFLRLLRGRWQREEQRRGGATDHGR